MPKPPARVEIAEVVTQRHTYALETYDERDVLGGVLSYEY